MTDKRVQELQNKIDNLKDEQINSNKPKQSSLAFIDVASELVAGVIVGVILGSLVDNLFNSKPLFLIICVIFAMTAVFRSIWKKHIIKTK